MTQENDTSQKDLKLVLIIVWGIVGVLVLALVVILVLGARQKSIQIAFSQTQAALPTATVRQLPTISSSDSKNSNSETVNFSIINNEKTPPSKCILDIRLTKKISKDEIQLIADTLRTNEGKDCSPLFIFYFLPDDKPGIDMAWAYSNFNPQLEIKINGMDIETEATLNASVPKTEKNVIGTWLDDHAFSRTIIMKKVNGSYQMTTVYGDGSGETKTLYVKVVNGEDRLYENPSNYYGDYMVIKRSGNLAFYDNQGIIYELQPK